MLRVEISSPVKFSEEIGLSKASIVRICREISTGVFSEGKYDDVGVERLVGLNEKMKKAFQRYQSLSAKDRQQYREDAREDNSNCINLRSSQGISEQFGCAKSTVSHAIRRSGGGFYNENGRLLGVPECDVEEVKNFIERTPGNPNFIKAAKKQRNQDWSSVK